MLQQECKTRWTSTHDMSDSLMTMSQFPRLARMVRQYLAVLARFASPERLFEMILFCAGVLLARFASPERVFEMILFCAGVLICSF